jgi:uncharacterized protein YcaQ
MSTISTKRKMRRIALQAQGLVGKHPFGRGPGAVLKAIRHLGYVQIDTISVVQRAHHHVLWTRVPGYRPTMLDKLVADKQVFEYWFHAAAYLPMEDFRFALPRMHAIKSGQKHWFRDTSEKLMREVTARIRAEGPLMARDFSDAAKGKTGWWDWKPAKQALEQLFIQGDLIVVGREGFQKRYDLTERALPDDIDTRFPDFGEQAKHLIDTSLRANGFASRKSFTYLRKGSELRTAVAEEIAARVDAKSLLALGDTFDGYYALPDAMDTATPRVGKTVKLLSPFDNSVIQRERLNTVFDFDYQIECYVPAAKRTYGYFCLPVLYGDQLVGRIDCKAHRKESRLNVVSLHSEPKPDDTLIAALGDALNAFALFNECDSIAFSATVDKLWRVIATAT